MIRTRKDYTQVIASHDGELRKDFGLRSLLLFGSVAREQHQEGSDVDVCVEMPPKAYLLVRLKRRLEEILNCPVDVVRKHRHMSPYLLEEIEKDGIYVIR